MKRKSSGKEFLPSKKKKTVSYRYGKAAKAPEKAEKAPEQSKPIAAEDEASKPKSLGSMPEVFAYRHRQLQEKKVRIASLCNRVLAEPEENVGALKELRQMIETKDEDLCVTVAKLAAASLLEVYKVLIPGYKIRPPTDAEKKQRMKRDTKETWNYEEKLLMSYKSYLTCLVTITKVLSSSAKNRKTPDKESLPHHCKTGIGYTALKCLSELLLSKPHFNYRANIAAVVIRFAAHPSGDVSALCCATIEQLYREDRVGDVTLDVVKQTTALIKERNYDTDPRVLNTFLAIKIKNVNLKREVAEEMRDKNPLTYKQRKKLLSRTERKKKKEMEKVEKDLEEGQAEVKLQRKTELFTEITKQIFLTYFRILKKSQSSVLLPSVLEGLATFSHLINVEYFGDLFSVFHELIERDALSYRERLHCVLTVFTILSGDGDVLNVDPVSFYAHLYNALFYLTAGESNRDAAVALSCMDMMLVRRRKKVSRTRVLAFAKRTATLATQLAHDGAIACLASVCRVMHAHRYADVLLDSDCHFGSGVFMPQLQEPEHCNPENTAWWELNLLRRHYHSVVQKLAAHILTGQPLDGKRILPQEIEHHSLEQLFQDFGTGEMAFRPAVPAPEKQRAIRANKVSKAATDFLDEARVETLIDGIKVESTDFSSMFR